MRSLRLPLTCTSHGTTPRRPKKSGERIARWLPDESSLQIWDVLDHVMLSCDKSCDKSCSNYILIHYHFSWKGQLEGSPEEILRTAVRIYGNTTPAAGSRVSKAGWGHTATRHIEMRHPIDIGPWQNESCDVTGSLLKTGGPVTTLRDLRMLG